MNHELENPATVRGHPWWRRGVVTVAGLALAAITLQERGASIMYATPWRSCYWIAVVAPLLLLAIRLLPPSGSLRLPTSKWLSLVGGAAAVLLTAACLSPYRGPALLWSVLPISGLATFLLLHDWLQESTANAGRLAGATALGSAGVMLASFVYWIIDVLHLPRTEVSSARLFEMRLPHPLGHANYTAGLALLSLPWLVLAARNGTAKWRWAAWVMTCVTLFVLFMCGSRGGLLGLGALGVAAAWALRHKLKRLSPWVAFACAATLLLALGNPRVRHFFSAGEKGAPPNLSTVQRSAMLEAGWRMGLDRPLIGWGLHSTPLVYPRYRAELAGGADTVLQLHSTPVEIWAGLGIPGFVLLVGFAGLAAGGRARAPVAALTLAGYAVLALTDYQCDVPIFVFAVAILAAQLAQSGHPPTERDRSLVGGVLAITVGVLVWGARSDPTPAWNAEALVSARSPQGLSSAVELLQKSITSNPSQELPHFNLGWLLVISDPVGAEHHFRAAASLVPDKGGVYFGLGLARLNQGKMPEAAHAFALECINDPRFIASPWWNESPIGALRETTRTEFARMLDRLVPEFVEGAWGATQVTLLRGLQPAIGVVSPGPESVYRRERTGYAVLMRNQDLGRVVDLYDVREDPRFPSRVPFPLPPKGWLPSPYLLKLLDDDSSASH